MKKVQGRDRETEEVEDNRPERGSSRNSSESFTFFFDMKIEMIAVTKKKREQELRERYDEAMEMLSRNEVELMLLPLNNAEGKPVKNMASKKGKVTFEGDEEPLPNLRAYTSEWVTKPSEWIKTTVNFHVRCSITPYDLFIKTAKGLMMKNMEMHPKRYNLDREENVPIAVVLPSFVSIDTRAISLKTLQDKGLYIHFELVKLEGNKWKRCGFKDPE